jgi:hypothetical protein
MPISIGEDDYLAYRHWLGEALKESGCALHAYPCVPPWWTTRRTTLGAATLQTRWDNATP